MLLRLFSNSPNGTQLTLVNGAAVTGYSILNSIDWGNAVFQQALSGPRGSQGARAVAGIPDNRVVSIPVHIGPTGSVDSFNLKAAQLAEIVDEMRRFGGTIQWQATTQTVRQYLDVIGGCGLSRASWGRKGRIVDGGDVDVVAQCGPYMLGDPMDTFDGFSSDTLGAGDWTFDIANAGAGALSVAGGQLVPGATGTKRIRYTAKGYLLSDVQATVKITTGPTITNGIWGVSAKADPGGTDFSVTAEMLATPNNLLRVSLYGVLTGVSNIAFTPAASTTYWLRVRIEGHLVWAEVFTSAPNAGSTPAQQVAAVLTPAQAQKVGAPGHVGLRLQTVDTAERYDDFTVEPFTYRNVSSPEQLRVGTIPGDVPAIVDATLTPKGGTATPVFGLLGWTERPLLHNMVWNGDFEQAGLGTSGWSVAAVAGVMGAASSLTRLTAQPAQTKYGTGALQIATPATTDTGATFRINRRVRAGRVLLAWLWASSSAGTTSARIKVGISGNLGTGTAAALSATPKLYSVAYPVVGLTELFYLAFGVNAATATNIVVDGAGVADVPLITLAAAITSGATSGTVYTTPSDTPNLLADGTLGSPFLAMIEQEIVRVTSIVGNAWTWDRAQEGTTAAAHAQDVFVGVLPPLRPHFEGKGALPPFGPIDAECYAAGLASSTGGAFTVTADANARLANVLRWAPSAGSQSAAVPFMIDPNLMIPDDYTDGELDLEVWLREAIHATNTNAKITLSALPEGGSVVGPERFSREFGNTGKLIVAASTGKVNRWHRLGTLPLTVDRANPLRWQLKLALSCIGGATPQWDLDTLVLVPTRARLNSPTGEPNDVATTTPSYPSFVPYNPSWGSTSAMSKTLRSDMTATIATPGDPSYPDAGLGDVLEVPDTDVDVVCMFSSLVPDDPTSDATDSTPYGYNADLHLAVTPRYVLARAS